MEEYKPLSHLYEKGDVAESQARRILEAPRLGVPTKARFQHCFFESWLELWPQLDNTDEKMVSVPKNYIKHVETTCKVWRKRVVELEKGIKLYRELLDANCGPLEKSPASCPCQSLWPEGFSDPQQDHADTCPDGLKPLNRNQLLGLD